MSIFKYTPGIYGLNIIDPYVSDLNTVCFGARKPLFGFFEDLS
jgi:hypothetical protein